MNEKYFVSRQNYCSSPANERVVEIAIGGVDYAGPDMLTASFADLGEGNEFADPREALKAARNICLGWVAVNHEIEVSIVIMGSDLDGHQTGKRLDEWAETEYEKLVKCDQCGQVVGGDPYVLFEVDYISFCSNYCAEEYEAQRRAWCSRCDNDAEATHVLNHGDVETFLCDHCTGAFKLGQAYPKTALEVLD